MLHTTLPTTPPSPYPPCTSLPVATLSPCTQSIASSGAYVLGEYGGRIKTEVPCMEQYRLLCRLFPGSSPAVKGLLITAFVKMLLQDHQV